METGNPATREFAWMVDEYAQHVDKDSEDNEPVTTSGSPDAWSNLTLDVLFDFTTARWKLRYELYATLSFDEESEMYDLLDLDTPGDDDLSPDPQGSSNIDIDLDEDTHATLTN